MNDDTRLHDIAKRLGAQAAERLDVDKTARAVVERLREQPAARPSWVPAAWLRIAAALVILAGGALLARQLTPSRDEGHAVAHLVTDDLRDLSADQLRQVLNTLDETLESGRTAPSDSTLDDLDEQLLRAVLRSLEG
ncbi:MAG: hypothetical protein WD773_03435 [Gemmatimonadales bacterium]